MNRIVRERYPVAQLPEDLRKSFPGQDEVTLTVDGTAGASDTDAENPHPGRVKSLEELFALAQPTFRSLDEVSAHVRSLRDEWM